MLKVKKVSKKVSRKKKKVKPKLELSLPGQKKKPSKFLQDYTILVYGQKKVGKTSLASMMEEALFFECEPGTKSLEVYGVPVNNWEEFIGYVSLVVKDKKFKTVVIDTIDIAYDYCMEYVCKKLLIDHPSDEGWGKGWKAVRNEFVKQINRLTHTNKGVVFISHSKEEEITKRGGDKFHRTSNTMPGQAKEAIEGIVDIWGYYTYEGEKRYLIIQGDDFIDAGSRCERHFEYTDGTRIRKIPMGESKEESYENFMKAFNNELPKAKVKVKKKLKLRK